MFQFSKARFNPKQIGPLLFILAVALTLRLNFVTGNVRADPLNYAHAAHELASGNLHLDSWSEGTTRIGLYFPTAALYRFFGVHEWTTLAYPLVSSLLTIIFVYLIGFHLDGEKAGLGAAILWSFFSLDVHQSTILLPDGPMTTFCTGAILFLVIAMKSPRSKAYWLYAVSLLFMGWAILIKPLAFVTVIFVLLIALMSLWDRRKRFYDQVSFLQNPNARKRLFYFLSAVFVLLGLLVYRHQIDLLLIDLSQTATDAGRLFVSGEINLDFSTERLTHTEILIFLTPLFVAGIVCLIRDDYKPARFALVWLAVYYIYYEWGTVTPDPSIYAPIKNFVDPRNLLFATVPFFVVAGIYLGRGFGTKTARQFSFLSSGAAILIAFYLKPFLVSGSPLPNWFAAVLALTLLGSVTSPFFLTGKKLQWKEQAAGAFLIVLAVSSNNPAPPYQVAYWNKFRAYMADLDSVAEIVEETNIPIYVPHSAMAVQLSYASEFELTYDWAEQYSDDSDFQIRLGSPRAFSEGVFVVGLSEIKEIGDNFGLVALFENDYQDIFLYKLGE